MSKIRKNDNVSVMSGKDRGRQGKVLAVIKKRTSFAKKKQSNTVTYDTFVLVENLNVVKKHIRANPQAGQQGGIVSKEKPIHISNVMLVNPTTGKPERVGMKQLEDGRKVRVFKKSGEVLDV